jgi:acyl-CoA thioesterase II
VDARQFLQVIEHDAATWDLPVRVELAGGRGQLFGGVALGAAVTQLEDLTGRPVVWATGQYISNAFPPDVVRFDAEVVVEGHNLTQARVIGHVDGREVLTVQAALGRRDYPGDGRWVVMPTVPAPDQCPPRETFPDSPGRLHYLVEQRIAAGEWGDASSSPSGLARVWVRMADALMGSTLGLAIAADFVPLAIRAALGRETAFGASLDNTVRYVARADTEWVLADFAMSAIEDGIGHGSVRLWSPEGELLAVGSQTCMLRDL